MIFYRSLTQLLSIVSLLLGSTYSLRADSLVRGLEPRQTSNVGPLPNDSETFIDKLWNENGDLVDQFLNNAFVLFQAREKQEDTLASYRYYSLQDYYYLLDFVKYRALRLSAFPDLSSPELQSYLANETKSLAGYAAYPDEFRTQILIGNLTMSPCTIDHGNRTVAELAYSNWLQKDIDAGWFSLYVKSIPCVYGWVKLAQKLDGDPATNKTTVFYSTWINANKNSTSGERLSNLLDNNVQKYNTPYMYEIWTSMFRQALQFEINFFNDAMNKTL